MFFAVYFLSIENDSVRLEFRFVPVDLLGVLLVAVEDRRGRVPLDGDAQAVPSRGEVGEREEGEDRGRQARAQQILTCSIQASF